MLIGERMSIVNDVERKMGRELKYYESLLLDEFLQLYDGIKKNYPAWSSWTFWEEVFKGIVNDIGINYNADVQKLFRKLKATMKEREAEKKNVKKLTEFLEG